MCETYVCFNDETEFVKYKEHDTFNDVLKPVFEKFEIDKKVNVFVDGEKIGLDEKVSEFIMDGLNIKIEYDLDDPENYKAYCKECLKDIHINERRKNFDEPDVSILSILLGASDEDIEEISKALKHVISNKRKDVFEFLKEKYNKKIDFLIMDVLFIHAGYVSFEDLKFIKEMGYDVTKYQGDIDTKEMADLVFGKKNSEFDL